MPLLSPRPVLFLFAVLFYAGCAAKSENQERTRSEYDEFPQYMVEGQKLYNMYCTNCHQHDGQGLGRVFPPLNDPDHMEANFEQVICLIKNGQRGGITMNDDTFTDTMPGAPHLSNLELAQITTYIYNSWSHKRGITTIDEIAVVLGGFCK